MSKKYTNEQIAEMKLVGYERTKDEATQLKKDHEEETGRKCIVIGSGVRARRNSYDRPWQVRELPAN